MTSAARSSPRADCPTWKDPRNVPELYAHKLQETLAAESLLLGRVTYEGFSAAWSARDGEFADKMNAMPKHVVTAYAA